MVYAFDTLGYAQRLRSAGLSQELAEAHAEAARDFVMGQLVTQTDLQNTAGRLEGDLQNAVDRLEQRIDRQTLVLTVRLGLMLAGALTILAAVLRLTGTH